MPQTGCLVCNEAITNPICSDCIGKEIEEWLLEKRPDLVEKFRDFGKLDFDYTSTNCIVCGRDMHICAHCYCSDIRDWLRDISEELEKDFISCFNFELT